MTNRESHYLSIEITFARAKSSHIMNILSAFSIFSKLLAPLAITLQLTDQSKIQSESINSFLLTNLNYTGIYMDLKNFRCAWLPQVCIILDISTYFPLKS